MSYRLGVTVSCRLGATVSYLLGATLSYRLGAIGPRFCTIFVYPLTFLVGPKVFSGKTSLLNSVQWSGHAHVGQIPETKPYSYQTLLLGTADFCCSGALVVDVLMYNVWAQGLVRAIQ